MINAFQQIGKSVLSKNGYYETDEIMKKRKILLLHQSLIPKAKIDKKTGEFILEGKAICLNFNLEDDTFEFKLSDLELDEENREKLLAFKLAAPKDKKKFFATNNVTTFYSAVFKESIEYILDKEKNKKSKNWFSENTDSDYKKFLQQIFERFYKLEGKEFLLNKEKLIEKQQFIYDLIFEEFGDKKFDEIWNRFLNKLFFDSNSKNIAGFPSVFQVTFDGESIFEIEAGKYADSYLNICYYDLIERFSIEKGRSENLCHICKNEGIVVQDIPLPMKFYGTTNSLNFESLSSSNAYKSFAVCQNCLPEILTGMKFVESNLNDYLFGLQTYIIPKSIKKNKFDAKMYKQIIKIIGTKRSQFKNEIMKIREILKKANKKQVYFDFLFYFHPAGSQQFDILKLISNIDANELFQKLDLFDFMSDKYKLNLLTDKFGDKSLTLSDLRNYLFPSMASQSKNPDFNIYGKDLLNFFETFFNGNKLNYTDLIHKFIKIYRKRLHRDRIDYLSPFKMVIALTIFNKLNQLKHGGNMENGNYVSEISNEDYRNFFETHSSIYEGNAYRQGLFLLGTVISKIKYVQKDKSSNFLKKMNMEGMPTRRIPGFINQVRDFANIYKKQIYEESGIWGNIMDRIQGIDNSNIKPDEVVFYILTGISFADYLGMKRGMEKKLKENEGEGK